MATPSDDTEDPHAGPSREPTTVASPFPPPREPGDVAEHENGRRRRNWMNIVSFVASVATPLAYFVPPLFAGALIGIVMGHLGVIAVRRGRATNRGLGIAGMVIGYAFVVLTPLAFVAVIVYGMSEPGR